MPVKTARKYFLGQEGSKRLNCAQSVAGAFLADPEKEQEVVDLFASCGGGNAPEGLCGAFYAAKYVCEKELNCSETVELENFFLQEAGSLQCKEIKALKRLSCVGCVEKCAEFLATQAEASTCKEALS